MTPDLQMVFQTRFSFFGSSGWRSPANKNKDILFDPERLSKRLYLFEKITLRCLKDQTDEDFKLLVLTSRDLPDVASRQLTEACHDIIGAERTFISRRKPDRAGKWMRRCMRNHLNFAEHSAQIVLDDDDAVSVDFVEHCRAEAQYTVSRFTETRTYSYLSFANGVSAVFNTKGSLDLMPREVAFNNQGLTLVAPTMTWENPYLIAHKRITRSHPVRVIYDRRPYFLRSVHDTNDSRAMHGDTPCDAEAADKLMTWFPLLGEFRLAAKEGTYHAAA